MLSRFLQAGIAAAALAVAIPALAEPSPMPAAGSIPAAGPMPAGPIPPRKPNFGAAKLSAETRKAPAAEAASIDPGVPAEAPRATGLLGALAALSAPSPAQPQADSSPGLFGDSGGAAAPIGRSRLNALIAHHARINNVPEALVHRIVIRESRYNPRAVGRGGAMGLMQIKTATARGVGYQGGPAGLLDAETNLTYGVKYLAGAWRVSGGSQDRAVGHYARGYYYEAKRLGLHGPSRRSRRGGQPDITPAAAPAPSPTLFSFFSQ